ncbi:hypothetical protein F5Y03DRAFT_341486 [Xylaria venustula]|nr:hypothetical protein F5Y03DRAFT_341486 [Xylaria venustula]
MLLTDDKASDCTKQTKSSFILIFILLTSHSSRACGGVGESVLPLKCVVLFLTQHLLLPMQWQATVAPNEPSGGRSWSY